jgi:hypothetical protein
MRHRNVLRHWRLATGRRLSDDQLDDFFNRPEVNELANTPEAILRDSAAAATVRGPDGTRLKLDRWVAEARALRNRRTVLNEAGRPVADVSRTRAERHAPADRDLHKRVADLLGDTGHERP